MTMKKAPMRRRSSSAVNIPGMFGPQGLPCSGPHSRSIISAKP
jgi:hypothetical protein